METDFLLDSSSSPQVAAATSRESLRVLIAGGADVMQSPGGGEVQMLSTAESLAQIGARARLWRRDNNEPLECDCLHLFGSLPEFVPLVKRARAAGIRVLLSPIAWFDAAAYWRGGDTIVGGSLALGRYMLRAAFPRMSSWRRRLYHDVNMLLPNSVAEAQQLMRLFKVPARRIHVVPNGANPRFAAADPELFVKEYNCRDFVLCIGRIEPRKNQLGLIRALKGTAMPLVIIGAPVPGHEPYYDECRRQAGANVRFIGRIGHDDPLLASAYGACRCLALASWFETPGLVAIEAAMSGVPLVLPKNGSAYEYFGDQAIYVRPDKTSEIRAAVQIAFDARRDERLAQHVIAQFTWRRVAEETLRAYRRTIREK